MPKKCTPPTNTRTAQPAREIPADIGISVGLGTFPFSNVFSTVDQKAAEEIVGEFITLGGRYIETAPVYPVNGVSISDIIAQYERSDLFLSTKCVTGFKNGVRTRSGDPEWIKSQLQSELARLGIGYLDLLQAHIVPEDVSIELLMKTLLELKEQEYTRFIGLSNVSYDNLSAALAIGRVDFVQNRYSFLYRSAHQAVMKLCIDNNIILNPYQVIERGQLTSKGRDPEHRKNGQDVRNTKHEYVGEAYLVIRAWVEELLVPISSALGVSLEALIIAWTRYQSNLNVPIVGFTNAAQVRTTIAGANILLSTDVFAKMERAYTEMNLRTIERFGLNIEEYRGLN